MRKEMELLIEKEEFRARVEKAESLKEVMDIFKENGVEVSEDELKAFAGEELSDEELDNVAGGVWHDYINPGYWLGRAVKKYLGGNVCW